jgi:hypothetical protein
MAVRSFVFLGASICSCSAQTLQVAPLEGSEGLLGVTVKQVVGGGVLGTICTQVHRLLVAS